LIRKRVVMRPKLLCPSGSYQALLGATSPLSAIAQTTETISQND